MNTKKHPQTSEFKCSRVHRVCVPNYKTLVEGQDSPYMDTLDGLAVKYGSILVTIITPALRTQNY